jgi:hypothetical protein
MRKPHEKGVAIRSALSFAQDIARGSAKRKQGKRWAGYWAARRFPVWHLNANVRTTGPFVRGEGKGKFLLTSIVRCSGALLKPALSCAAGLILLEPSNSSLALQSRYPELLPKRLACRLPYFRFRQQGSRPYCGADQCGLLGSEVQ